MHGALEGSPLQVASWDQFAGQSCVGEENSGNIPGERPLGEQGLSGANGEKESLPKAFAG